MQAMEESLSRRFPSLMGRQQSSRYSMAGGGLPGSVTKTPGTVTTTEQHLLKDCEPTLAGEHQETDVDTQTPRKHGILRQWWQEIAAIILSVLALIALVVTLYPHNNQPLPKWPYSISVNTLVSIYVVIFKAAILFATAETLSQLKWLWYRRQRPLHHVDVYDQASRGPMGSLKFLWAIGHRDTLATTGALIIILMVIIDPFTQQILSYYGCSWPVPDMQVFLPRSSFLGSLGADSLHLGGGVVSVPPRWQSAVVAGLLSAPQVLPVLCATGNCTYQGAYSTLGFCSTCSDVSDELKITNETYVTDVSPDGNATYNWMYSSSLPSGFKMTSPAGNGCVDWIGMKTVQPGIVEIVMPKTPLTDVMNYTSIFRMYPSNCSSSGDNLPWSCRGYGAARCSIYPCVKTLNSNVTVGILKENVVSTSPSDQWAMDPSGWYESTLDLNCTTSEQGAKLQSMGYHWSPGQRWLGFNASFNGPNSSYDELSNILSSQGCLYSYLGYVVKSLWTTYLGTLFNGTVSGCVGSSQDPRIVTGSQCPLQIFNWGEMSFERTTEIFANISQSMSTITRQLDALNQTAPQVGTAYHDQTCLRTRWPWLSFSASMLIAACTFFIIALVMQHRAEHVPSWKSSTLPMLLNVFLPTSEVSRESDQVAHLERVACQTRVQLGRTQTGIRLVEDVKTQED